MRLPVRHVLSLLMVLGVLSLLAVSVQAAGAPQPDRQGGVVQVGQDWTLPAGQTERGDVLIISADALVDTDARLIGDLTVISGDVTVRGTVDGDVNVFSGDVTLEAESRVTGDVNVLSGSVHQAPGAVVEGEVVRGSFVWPQAQWGTWFRNVPGPVWGWTMPEPWTPQWFLWVIGRVIFGFFRSLIVAVSVAAVAAVLVLIWPDQVDRVARTAEEAFLPALGVGLLTWVIGGVIIAILLITICFTLLGLLGLMALLGLTLLGWTALGKILGERLWTALNLQGETSLWPTVIGVFLLTWLTRVPCVGWVIGFFAGSVALGAAIITLYSRYAAHRSTPVA